MTDTTVPTAAEAPAVDAIFGKLWPDPGEVGRPRLVGAALAVGLMAAVVLPYRAPGLGTFLVLAGALAVVAAAARRHPTSLRIGGGMLCLLLAATVIVRDALWIVALCVLAAGAVGSIALSHGRSVFGIIASAVAVPMATLRGFPWLARSLATVGGPAKMWPVLRTVLVSLVLLLTFGALFASADALFARWVEVLVPDLSVDALFERLFVLGVVTVATLAGVYVALVPPSVERLALARRIPVRRFEWAVPVGLVIGMFAVFLVAQLTALFGGHAYLRRTTGLTYADYVHQGFGQLTVATALTLAVIATAVRRASRDTATDRMWLRVLLGLLCALTLVVVASALYRMHVYEEAYGFTRLRVLVSVFESWLGVVLVLVLAAGVSLRGGWVPRAAVLSGAGMLLALAAVNPDGYIAERNVDRYQQTGKIDWSYLSGLSADAVPALDRLPEPARSCALGLRDPDGGDWLEWNLGRQRAAAVLEEPASARGADCSALD